MEKTPDADLLREMIGFAAHRLMELEVEGLSTGDRTILGKISRRGNRYLRVLFVQAAWVVLVKIKDWERYGLKSWIEAAKRRLLSPVKLSMR